MKPRSKRSRVPVDPEGRPILKTLRDFSDAYERAEHVCELRQLGYIEAAAKGDADRGLRPEWTASAWLLERRHPERYARPAQRLVHEGGLTNVNAEVVVSLAALDDEELEALERLTAKAIGRPAPAPQLPAPNGASGGKLPRGPRGDE